MLVALRLVIALGLVLAACGPAISPPGGRAATSIVSWPHYGDLARLVGSADLVVEGRVVRRLEVRDVRGHPEQRLPVSFTESLVQVTNVLKGSASDEVRVVQLGREGDPAQTYPEFPLLRPGEEVVLFLIEVSDEPIHSDGSTKFVVIAPVGLLHITGDRLSSNARGFESIDLATSMRLEEFRAMVTGLAQN